jgi:hypothetical protein
MRMALSACARGLARRRIRYIFDTSCDTNRMATRFLVRDDARIAIDGDERHFRRVPHRSGYC